MLSCEFTLIGQNEFVKGYKKHCLTLLLNHSGIMGYYISSVLGQSVIVVGYFSEGKGKSQFTGSEELR